MPHLNSLEVSRFRWFTLSSRVAPLALTVFSACLPATNPCDPAADPSIRRTASIAGIVIDQQGSPVAGVPVFISGAGDSKVSGDDGTFTFDALLPNDDGRGYEIIAVPQAPIAGGRTVAPTLGCEAAVSDVKVPVVVPPPSPEVEISQATAPDRLLVAFASASDDEVHVDESNIHDTLQGCDASDASLSYRIEVRAPFGIWSEAVLAQAPVVTAEAGALAVVVDDPVAMPPEEVPTVTGLVTKASTDDHCARATCGFYSYAYPALADNVNARCVEVVGLRAPDGSEKPLEAYERYEVRVRADVHVDDAEAKALPKTVSSAASAAPGELSLTPTAVLPVPLNPDKEVDAIMRAAIDIKSAAPINKDRFALINGDGMVVVGAGTLAAEEFRDVMGMDPATSEGMVMDTVTTTATEDEVMSETGDAAISLLPAGKWVRVWKRRANDSMIDKVFVGAYPGEEATNPNPEQPIFDVNMMFPGAVDAFRGFHWLARPAGMLTEGPYNPPDAYMLLFTRGLVILEQSTSGSSDPAMMSAASDTSMTSFYPSYDGGIGGSLCDAVNDIGVFENNDGTTTYGACWDLRSLNPDIMLADTKILATNLDDTSPGSTFHVFADEAGDAVVVVKSSHLIMQGVPVGATSIVDVAATVQVGLFPSALQPTQILDCAAGTSKPVMAVANRGSQDLSLLRVSADGNAAVDVKETAVVPLPAVPVGFFPDPIGPTCEDPYLWVVADDGRTFPVDMRVDRLSIPVCGEAECAVETRSRARVGAVGRNASGRGRVLLGGKGVLSEVGYLRPSLTPTFEVTTLE